MLKPLQFSRSRSCPYGPASSTASGPITLLVAIPAMAVAIAVVDVDADARIIVIAVPAERIVAAIIAAIIAVAVAAIAVAAVAVAAIPPYRRSHKVRRGRRRSRRGRGRRSRQPPRVQARNRICILHYTGGPMRWSRRVNGGANSPKAPFLPWAERIGEAPSTLTNVPADRIPRPAEGSASSRRCPAWLSRARSSPGSAARARR